MPEIMDVMKSLGDVIQAQINKVSESGEDAKKKMELAVQSVIDEGKNKLALVDAALNEKFDIQDKKVENKLSEFKSKNVQPLETKFTEIESKVSSLDVKHSTSEQNVAQINTKVSKLEERLKSSAKIMLGN